MNQYLVEYTKFGSEETGYNAEVISAHRVESWSNDYAFFSHPKFLGELTHLIPRTLVKRVTMSFDSHGQQIGPGVV